MSYDVQNIALCILMGNEVCKKMSCPSPLAKLTDDVIIVVVLRVAAVGMFIFCDAFFGKPRLE
jgi:hypothetical protein